MKKTHLLLTALMCLLTFWTTRAQISPVYYSSDQPACQEEEVVVELISDCEVEVVEMQVENENPPEPVDLSKVGSKFTFQHQDFTLDFPSEYWVKEKSGLEIISCVGPGYELSSVVCPLGLEIQAVPAISSELSMEISLENPTQENFAGLTLSVFEIRDREQSDFGKMYVYNSGDKTYFLFQKSEIASPW